MCQVRKDEAYFSYGIDSSGVYLQSLNRDSDRED